MNYLRTEEEVDKIIDEMVRRTKGRYITQGVSFSKSCPRQLGLLKRALMSSSSFSGLVKEILAVKLEEHQRNINQSFPQANNFRINEPKSKDISSFL